jgi:RNA-binding protein
MRKDELGSSEMRSTLQIGKNGFTDAVLDEIDDQLERTGAVKVNMLRSAPEAKAFKAAVAEAAVKLKATLIGVRGRTAVFKRAKGRKARPEKK